MTPQSAGWQAWHKNSASQESCFRSQATVLQGGHMVLAWAPGCVFFLCWLGGVMAHATSSPWAYTALEARN